MATVTSSIALLARAGIVRAFLRDRRFYRGRSVAFDVDRLRASRSSPIDTNSDLDCAVGGHRSRCACPASTGHGGIQSRMALICVNWHSTICTRSSLLRRLWPWCNICAAAGTWVITNDGWFTLGEPFDRPTPNGLRTVYPLTLQTTTLAVHRKGVSYQ